MWKPIRHSNVPFRIAGKVPLSRMLSTQWFAKLSAGGPLPRALRMRSAPLRAQALAEVYATGSLTSATGHQPASSGGHPHPRLFVVSENRGGISDATPYVAGPRTRPKPAPSPRGAVGAATACGGAGRSSHLEQGPRPCSTPGFHGLWPFSTLGLPV